MYQYTFDEETTKKIKDSTSKSSDIINEFNEIDRKYSKYNSPETKLELTEMPYKTVSQEEVQSKAENNLSDYKNAGIDSINQKYDDKIQSVTDSIKSEDKKAKESQENLVQSYEKAKDNAQKDAIKRGLARSSIIVNKLANFDQNLIDDLNQQKDLTIQKIDGLNEQKALLEEQKQNALSAFDITYAVKLQNEIESINSQIDEQNQAALKYNNQIAETIAKWEKEQEENSYKRAKQLNDMVSEYGTDVFETLKQSEKYEIAKKYFEDMSKEEALLELKNNIVFKQNLGSIYNKLVKEIESK